ncbi:Slow green 1 protein [Thalictrum thalictroides]|uniref:Slow green 1 protein n=1 Tax=Thalictrum thalictroides TaxID=46969 RepID=A0A7J6VP10_THATH|nr:Slow green 1 protein [Thalictrum thalictroides]
MGSLSRVAFINGVSCTPFNSTRTTLSPSPPTFFSLISSNSQSKIRVRVLCSLNSESEKNYLNPLIQKIQDTSKVLIFTAAAALAVGKFSQFPAKAESPVAVVEKEEEQRQGEEKEEEKLEESPLSEFIESHSEAIDALKSLLQRKLEDGEDEEALKILKRLISAQPNQLEWKFLTARLYNENGEKGEARKVYEEILDKDPLCFDALFQNAVLMDQCGEGLAALRMLEERLNFAQDEQKEVEARNLRFIMAQIQYLQKNIDEALNSYEELAKEDPADYRPYFYQFVIYSLLDRNDEAKMQFAKCREVCPKDFKVEGFLQTPLSRMKLFGSGSDN